MSVSVQYSKISIDKERHVNHCGVTVTHQTKENPVHSFVK